MAKAFVCNVVLRRLMEDDSLQRTIFAVWAANQQRSERVLLLVTGDMQPLSKTVGGVKRSIDFRTLRSERRRHV